MEVDGQAIIRKHGRFFARGEAIFQEGEPAQEMFLLHRGKVRVVKRVAGQPVCLEILGEGDFFGERAILSGGLRGVAALADEDTWLLPVDADTLRRLLAEQPEVAWRFVSRLAERLEALEDRLVAQIARAEGGRVADALCALAAGVEEGQALPLDRAALASRAGVLVERAERSLAQLERAGAFERLEGGGYRLRSRRALEDYVEYCALKARCDPLELSELADLTGLGQGQVEVMAERVIRRRLDMAEPAERERTLRSPLQRYLELKLRFELTRPAVGGGLGHTTGAEDR